MRLLHTRHNIESNNNYIAAGMVAMVSTRLSAFLSRRLGGGHVSASGGANSALNPSKTFVGKFSSCAAFGERVAQGFSPAQWVVEFPKVIQQQCDLTGVHEPEWEEVQAYAQVRHTMPACTMGPSWGLCLPLQPSRN